MLEKISNEYPLSWWIRPAGTGAGLRDKQARAAFRLDFVLETLPESAIVHVSAADRYRLSVNGESVVSGPQKGDRWNHYYETVDIAPFLKIGKNSIAARVVSYAYLVQNDNQNGPFSVYAHNTGIAFWFQGTIGGTSLSSGEAAWTGVLYPEGCLQTEGPDAYAGGGEIFDLSLEPDWRNPENPGWSPAEKYFQSSIGVCGEFSAILLKERPTPNPRETEGVFHSMNDGEALFETVEIPTGESRSWIFDAQTLRTGYLRLRAKGKGGKLTATYAERFFPRDPAVHSGTFRRDNSAEGKLTGVADIVFTAPGWKTYDPFWFRAFRFVRLEAQAGEEPLCLEVPRFRETAYPLEISAELSFDRPQDEALWQISLRTLRCCMHDTHEDCPYYEQLQYIMDTRLQMLFVYAVSGDIRMARSVIWNFHCSMLPDGILQSRYPCERTQVIPVFALHWIYMLEEYYTQTGDAELLRFYRPTIDAVLAYFDRHIAENGMAVHLGYWDFSDWVPEWSNTAGVPSAAVEGPSTVQNLVLVNALFTAARILRVAGRPGVAAEYEERAEKLKAAILTLCFDEDKELLREGPAFAQYSQHAQILAVLTGLFTGERAKRVMNRVMDDKTLLQCTFPWHFTLMRALEKAGLYARSAEIWPEYYTLLKLNLSTLPEMPGDTRSDCHAWSAVPLYEWIRMRLGVKPGAPAWQRIRIEPHPLDWKSLRGKVPTPVGEVMVQWESASEGFRLRAQTPAGVPVDVLLPDGRSFAFSGGSFEI